MVAPSPPPLRVAAAWMMTPLMFFCFRTRCVGSSLFPKPCLGVRLAKPRYGALFYCCAPQLHALPTYLPGEVSIDDHKRIPKNTPKYLYTTAGPKGNTKHKGEKLPVSNNTRILLETKIGRRIPLSKNTSNSSHTNNLILNKRPHVLYDAKFSLTLAALPEVKHKTRKPAPHTPP